MELPRVVFFGRTGVEACRFFNLSLAEWRGASLLNSPGGPGSLAALARRCREDIAFAMERLRQSSTLRADFNLEPYHLDKLQALEVFLADRQAHLESYTAGALPELPLADSSFDLVLSGHLLFAYAPLADGGLHEADCFDLAWHRRALAELLRVCRQELRIFPAHTITLPTRVHPYMAPLLNKLPAGWQASLEPTSYDQGAVGETQLLRICRVGPNPAQLESARPLPALV